MEDNELLTAEEGADRVAKRIREMQILSDIETDDDKSDTDIEKSENNTVNYNCENCGSNVFLFTRSFETYQTIRKTLECSCGETDLASIIDSLHTVSKTLVGRLNAGHYPDYHDTDYGDEKIDEEQWDDIDSEINCQECVNESQSHKWEHEELEEWQVNEESEYCELRCADCDHEIEFGWSHPGRGGRIWPCESTDFKPRMTVPEPRFLDAWNRRGWLRTS